MCTPEVLSALDYVACSHAMLRIARQAQMAAQENLPPEQAIQLLANNSDGRGHSYGSHLNFLITRRAWENIFHRKVHYLGLLASYQVSSIVFTGQGKVGSENGQPPVAYQIAARPDFFETLVGSQTTFRRPIVNSRDEPLCGREPLPDEKGPRMARLHVIFYDNSLCHVASFLKVGVMQVILAMIECECVDPGLILDDPVAAAVAWSHDPGLRTTAKTAAGDDRTAVQLQMMFLEAATRFVEKGRCEGIVPDARKIMQVWKDTILPLQAAASSGDLAALAPLAPRLDWVLKLAVLQRAMAQRPDLTWDSPQIRQLDHLYASVAPDGPYWAYENNGVVERLVTEAQIERFCHEPPEDTRAWSRARLLQDFQDEVTGVDWDRIQFEIQGSAYWPERRTLPLNSPLGFTRTESEPLLHRAANLSEFLDEMPQSPAVEPQASAAALPEILDPVAPADEATGRKRKNDQDGSCEPSQGQSHGNA
jgi:proteasome accessory factor A